MVKGIHTKVIEIPFYEKESSVLLEQQLTNFLQEKKLSLKEVQITHAVEYKNAFPTQRYTVFYEEK